MTSGDLTFDLTKNGHTSFMIFDALSNAYYRESLHGPGTELEGVFNPPSGPVRRSWHWAPARRGLINPRPHMGDTPPPPGSFIALHAKLLNFEARGLMYAIAV